jgi:Flp pilus assembly secretin CpaC
MAEVSRNAIREFNSQLIALNPQDLRDDGDIGIETISDGLVRLFLSSPGARLDAVFRALRTTGEVRTLAEPNLIAMDGSTASFLAGGEFPFPVVQAGGDDGARITIQWREFGVRLNFTPFLTGGGNIRLQVAPEVSSLDFASGLVVSGFAVPALLTAAPPPRWSCATGRPSRSRGCSTTTRSRASPASRSSATCRSSGRSSAAGSGGRTGPSSWCW